MSTVDLIVMLFWGGFAASFLVAWPVVGWFVVRPIQKKMRANNEDVVSQWIIFLWKPWVYAWAVFYPIGRFNNGVSHFYSNPERMKVYANKTQWWLCAWMSMSMILFLLISLLWIVPAYYFFGIEQTA